MSIHRKTNKAITYAYRAISHKISVCYSYLDWIFVFSQNIQKILRKEIGDYKVVPFNIRGWHNGTSTYLVNTNSNNEFFIKKSFNEHSILAEVECVRYIKSTMTNADLFHTCNTIYYSNSYVVESFIEGNQLSDENFVIQLNEEEKEQILEKLLLIIIKFREIGFVHCDFTPKNIIVNDKQIYIIDFEYSVYETCDFRNNKSRKNSTKLKKIGSHYAMGNGIADDAYCLSQIAKHLIPNIISSNYDLWRTINTNIGIFQYNLLQDTFIRGNNIKNE